MLLLPLLLLTVVSAAVAVAAAAACCRPRWAVDCCLFSVDCCLLCVVRVLYDGLVRAHCLQLHPSVYEFQSVQVMHAWALI